VSALRSCEQLRDLALPHTTITAAAAVPEGSVRATMGPAQVAPAHCAVQGVTRPTKDSEIRFELWLPVSG
jgi:feruloyl esterase